jgi:hypothetical protein
VIECHADVEQPGELVIVAMNGDVLREAVANASTAEIALPADCVTGGALASVISLNRTGALRRSSPLFPAETPQLPGTLYLVLWSLGVDAAGPLDCRQIQAPMRERLASRKPSFNPRPFLLSSLVT